MALRKDEAQLDVTINGKKAGTTLDGLEKNARDLNREVRKLEPGTQAFIDKTADLQKVKARLGQIRDEMNGIDRSFLGSIKSAFSFQNVIQGIAGILPSLSIAGLVSGAKALFSETLNLYDGAAKADAQLKAAIESTNGAAGRSFEQLKQQAAELQKTTLFDDDATGQAQGLLLTFTKVREEIFDRSIPTIQDYAQAMANASGGTADLKSATLQVGKALNDPIKGISALSKAGVQFSAEQKEMIKTFVETGQSAKAQEVILKELETQFGGSAKAAAEAGTGGWTQFGNRMDNIKESIGELIVKGLNLLSPAMDVLASVLEAVVAQGANVILFFAAVPKFIKDNAVEIGLLTIAIIAMNKQMVLTQFNLIKEQALAAKKLILDKAAIVSTWSLTGAQKALNAAFKANPIGLIVTIVALLITGLIQLYKRSENVQASIAGIGAVAKEIFKIVKEAFQSFADAFTALKEGRIGDALKDLGSAIVKTNPIGLAISQGGRLKSAFLSGFAEKKESIAMEQEAEALLKESEKLKETGTKAGEAVGEAVVTGITDKFKDIAKLSKKQIESEIAKITANLSTLDSEGLQDTAEYEAFSERKIALQNRLDQLLGTAQSKANEKQKEAEEKAAAERLKLREDQLKLDLEAIRLASEREAILLESKFLKKELTEAEYNQRLYNERSKALDLQILQLEESGVAEAAAIEKLQLEKLKLENEYDKKLEELELQRIANEAKKQKDQIDALTKAGQERLAAEELALKEKLLLQGDAENVALNEKFANQVKAEQAFQEQLLQLKLDNFNSQLALLEANGFQETEAFKKIQQEKLDTQIEFNKQRTENEKRTQDLNREIEKSSLAAANDFFALGIELLGKDKEARKKNAGAIIAFESARILTSLYTEIAGYYASMSKLGPVGVAIASVMAGIGTIRAFNNISKLKSQEFYDGGQVKKDPFTLPMISGKDGKFRYQPNVTPTRKGDNVLAYVKTGETILTPKHVDKLGGPATMRRIGVPGYNLGGVSGLVPTDVNTTPSLSSISFQSSGSGEMMMLISELKGLRNDVQNSNREIRAKVVYSDLENISNDISNTQNRASI